MNEQNRPASGGGSRKTVTTGSFRFAQAHLRGVVVRDGPVTRYSQAGTPWTECTLLVGLYDGRQKCERERPAFVRVKAFGDRSALLDGLQKRDHVSVAGALAIDVWEDRDGRLRESYELYADAVSREAFPPMAELLQQTPPADEPGTEEPSVADAWNDATDPNAERRWEDAPAEDGGAQTDPKDLTEDDIPF